MCTCGSSLYSSHSIKLTTHSTSLIFYKRNYHHVLNKLLHYSGKQICKAATQKGWTVTSLSRSGEPLWAESPSSADGNKPAWSSKVQWKKADIFNADSYDYVLRDVDAVVHTMGILLENDYKKFISGEKSPLALLSSSLLGSGGGTGASRRLPPGNPLLKTNKGMPEYVEQDRDAHVQEERVETSAGKLTYERINRDSGSSFLT